MEYILTCVSLCQAAEGRTAYTKIKGEQHTHGVNITLLLVMKSKKVLRIVRLL